MFNRDTEVIFPARIIPELATLRGKTWQSLLENICALEPLAPEPIALTLMMARMNNCHTCQADSFKGMRGCTHCATQTIQRFKGSDEELKSLFQQSLEEVRQFISDTPLS